MSGELKFVDT